jgi:hypothetical protein
MIGRIFQALPGQTDRQTDTTVALIYKIGVQTCVQTCTFNINLGLLKKLAFTLTLPLV